MQKIKSITMKRNRKPHVLDSEKPIWLRNSLTRKESIDFLMAKDIGVFIIRKSETLPDCYVLSVKVAKYINATQISHYLIDKSATGSFNIRGFMKEFSDLSSLVTHCSFIRDMLPVLLNLNYFRNKCKSSSKKLLLQSTACLISQHSID